MSSDPAHAQMQTELSASIPADAPQDTKSRRERKLQAFSEAVHGQMFECTKVARAQVLYATEKVLWIKDIIGRIEGTTNLIPIVAITIHTAYVETIYPVCPAANPSFWIYVYLAIMCSFVFLARASISVPPARFTSTGRLRPVSLREGLSQMMDAGLAMLMFGVWALTANDGKPWSCESGFVAPVKWAIRALFWVVSVGVFLGQVGLDHKFKAERASLVKLAEYQSAQTNSDLIGARVSYLVPSMVIFLYEPVISWWNDDPSSQARWIIKGVAAGACGVYRLVFLIKEGLFQYDGVNWWIVPLKNTFGCYVAHFLGLLRLLEVAISPLIFILYAQFTRAEDPREAWGALFYFGVSTVVLFVALQTIIVFQLKSSTPITEDGILQPRLRCEFQCNPGASLDDHPIQVPVMPRGDETSIVMWTIPETASDTENLVVKLLFHKSAHIHATPEGTPGLVLHQRGSYVNLRYDMEKQVWLLVQDRHQDALLLVNSLSDPIWAQFAVDCALESMGLYTDGTAADCIKQEFAKSLSTRLMQLRKTDPLGEYSYLCTLHALPKYHNQDDSMFESDRKEDEQEYAAPPGHELKPPPESTLPAPQIKVCNATFGTLEIYLRLTYSPIDVISKFEWSLGRKHALNDIKFD